MGRSRLSYVLRDDGAGPLHTAGINALALAVPQPGSAASSSTPAVLYSGGRDGVINAWDLCLDEAHLGSFASSDVATTSEATATTTSGGGIPLCDSSLSASSNTGGPRVSPLVRLDTASHGSDNNNINFDQTPSNAVNFIPRRPSTSSEAILPGRRAASGPSLSAVATDATVARAATTTHGRPSSSSAAGVSGTKRIVSFSSERLPLPGRPSSASSMTIGRIVEHNRRIISTTPHALFHRSLRHHSDWVNDIALCNDNNHLVSCSSDCTILLWDTSAASSPATHPVKIGHHSDYVKRLAYASDAGFVASGGLDRRILLWDIQEPRNRPQLLMTSDSPSSSIYALACTPSGRTIVSGSPEKTVCVWDPRDTGNRPQHRLQGHTDNIRDLLISTDGMWIISASTDTTIKLWSLAMPSRCVTTYTHFDDSVWCLASPSPYLDTFYAGGRNGLVTKTIRRFHGDSDMQGDSGDCVVLCREKCAVTRIGVIEDAFVWTATTDSCLHRWRDVPTGKHSVSISQDRYRDDTCDHVGGASTAVSRSHIATRVKPDGQLILPKSSIVCHGTSVCVDEVASVTSYRVSEAASSTYSVEGCVNRGVGSGVVVDAVRGEASSIDGGDNNNEEEEEDDDDEGQALQPLWRDPDDIIAGAPGIIQHAILNNRRHVITKDTANTITTWDIIQCKKIKTHGVVDFDRVVKTENTWDWVSTWCRVDTSGGVLTIHLDERCCDAEIHFDDLDCDDTGGVVCGNDDQRICLGKWALTLLLMEYLKVMFPGDPVLCGVRGALGDGGRDVDGKLGKRGDVVAGDGQPDASLGTTPKHLTTATTTASSLLHTPAMSDVTPTTSASPHDPVTHEPASTPNPTHTTPRNLFLRHRADLNASLSMNIATPVVVTNTNDADTATRDLVAQPMDQQSRVSVVIGTPGIAQKSADLVNWDDDDDERDSDDDGDGDGGRGYTSTVLPHGSFVAEPGVPRFIANADEKPKLSLPLVSSGDGDGGDTGRVYADAKVSITVSAPVTTDMGGLSGSAMDEKTMTTTAMVDTLGIAPNAHAVATTALPVSTDTAFLSSGDVAANSVTETSFAVSDTTSMGAETTSKTATMVLNPVAASTTANTATATSPSQLSVTTSAAISAVNANNAVAHHASGSFMGKLKFRLRTNTSGSWRSASSDDNGSGSMVGTTTTPNAAAVATTSIGADVDHIPAPPLSLVSGSPKSVISSNGPVTVPAVVTTGLSALSVSASLSTSMMSAAYAVSEHTSGAGVTATSTTTPIVSSASTTGSDVPKRRKWSAAAAGFLGALSGMSTGVLASMSASQVGMVTSGQSNSVASAAGPADATSAAAFGGGGGGGGGGGNQGSSALPNPYIRTGYAKPESGIQESSTTSTHQQQQPANGPPTLHFSVDETPFIQISPTIPIIISYEDSPEAHTYMDVFRSDTGSIGLPHNAKTLTEVIPNWIRDWIVMNQPPHKDTMKLSFVLQPHPNSRHPELPLGGNRLTANRMLRIKKVVLYVADKLQLRVDPACIVTRRGDDHVGSDTQHGLAPGQHTTTRTPTSPSSHDASTPASTFIRIYCNDRVVSPASTLATVKHFVWKSGSDIQLYYL